MKNVQELENKIEAANQEQATAQEALDAAKATYQQAVKSGDLKQAKEAAKEQEERQRELDLLSDRLEALEQSRVEAEQRDHGPAYEQAKKQAQEALQVQVATHQEFAALVDKLGEMRQRLDKVHRATFSTVLTAYRAADAAHHTRPRYRPSQLASTGGPQKLLSLARELANVSNDNARQMFALEQRHKE
ncbi:hypothetical protein [Desulfurivibrio alkaliphilus]|uniref:Uncharacterized protein n=1 Tax=Desulfurivibrio alkaliphilus (strain DSM 19089 / UNIQEM U267 / AHT2) TaxID=589865 RepID=D6Z333_DESAT|nr:hypothetical protein [Desulfurivibrio alkaliphilus]ADH85958.1 conserved hypothetical protein [Desulfurivibrio alkaliphilus AHT 2]